MRRFAAVILMGLFLTGCGSLNNPLNGSFGDSSGGSVEVVEVEQYDPVTAGSADQRVTVEGEMIQGEAVDSVQQPAGSIASGTTPPAQRLFFFDYDSSTVSEEDLSVVKVHAVYLINNPLMIARLEGHADERGSREYNLALGERRAQTMSDLLVAEGVNPAQIEIISYGEENPLEIGHEEGFWAQNRRVELTYPQ